MIGSDSYALIYYLVLICYLFVYSKDKEPGKNDFNIIKFIMLISILLKNIAHADEHFNFTFFYILDTFQIIQIHI